MAMLGEQFQLWINAAPDWEAAHLCRDRYERFHERVKTFQKPANIPLVVAMLGGTGTGKSSLLNALLDEHIVNEGKERPTTNAPVLVCHTNADVAGFCNFQIERRNNPHLEQMMILDCPDPDTTDTENEPNRQNTNLEKLRGALPFCDILLVTATQQKYRSKRIFDELAAAAPGARLVFVQTHADKDIDIREDWSEVLKDGYETGQMFFVSSVGNGKNSGQLQELRHFLTRDLNEEAAIRIRQQNYFGLAEETVTGCQKIIENDWLSVNKLRGKISEERQKFGKRITDKIRSELIRDRRLWESKILGRVSAQWGYSPFSLLLRIYQGLGTILSGAVLSRVRSPVQLALWGTFESIRRLKKRKTKKTSVFPEFSVEEQNQLKESALILTGFATDAHIPVLHCQTGTIQMESKQANESLLAEIGAELEAMTDYLAQRHQHFLFRFFYETLITAMVLFLLARPAKNFFVDSFWYQQEMFGIDYYVISLFWLTVWSAMLLFFFTRTLRQGIERSIYRASQDWSHLPALDQLFAGLEKETTRILTFRDELEALQGRIDRINQQAEKLDKRLGRKRF